MTNTATALYEFWSSFGIPAFTVDTVPVEQELPYITYSLPETPPLEPLTHYAQVWYRTTKNVELMATVDSIKQAFGTDRKVTLRCNGGYVVLRDPTVQLQTDQNPENRYAYINMQINCYHS